MNADQVWAELLKAGASGFTRAAVKKTLRSYDDAFLDLQAAATPGEIAAAERAVRAVQEDHRASYILRRYRGADVLLPDSAEELARGLAATGATRVVVVGCALYATYLSALARAGLLAAEVLAVDAGGCACCARKRPLAENTTIVPAGRHGAREEIADHLAAQGLLDASTCLVLDAAVAPGGEAAVARHRGPLLAFMLAEEWLPDIPARVFSTEQRAAAYSDDAFIAAGERRLTHEIGRAYELDTAAAQGGRYASLETALCWKALVLLRRATASPRAATVRGWSARFAERPTLDGEYWARVELRLPAEAAAAALAEAGRLLGVHLAPGAAIDPDDIVRQALMPFLGTEWPLWGVGGDAAAPFVFSVAPVRDPVLVAAAFVRAFRPEAFGRFLAAAVWARVAPEQPAQACGSS